MQRLYSSIRPANRFRYLDGHLPVLGWAFDQEPVKHEIAALGNMVAAYRDPLNAGSVDTAAKQPEFVEKLKANEKALPIAQLFKFGV